MGGKRTDKFTVWKSTHESREPALKSCHLSQPHWCHLITHFLLVTGGGGETKRWGHIFNWSRGGEIIFPNTIYTGSPWTFLPFFYLRVMFQISLINSSENDQFPVEIVELLLSGLHHHYKKKKKHAHTQRQMKHDILIAQDPFFCVIKFKLSSYVFPCTTSTVILKHEYLFQPCAQRRKPWNPPENKKCIEQNVRSKAEVLHSSQTVALCQPRCITAHLFCNAGQWAIHFHKINIFIHRLQKHVSFMN